MSGDNWSGLVGRLGGASLHPQTLSASVPVILHPVTGQPLGIAAVVMMIPGEIMIAISEAIREVVRTVVREELDLHDKAFVTRLKAREEAEANAVEEVGDAVARSLTAQ